MSRQTQFKQEVRDAARALWQSHHILNALKAEAEALDYGTTLTVEDGEPSADDLLAVVYATNDAIGTLYASGHATNLSKVL